MARRKARSKTTKKGKKTNGKKSPVAATAPGYTVKTSGPHY